MLTGRSSTAPPPLAAGGRPMKSGPRPVWRCRRGRASRACRPGWRRCRAASPRDRSPPASPGSSYSGPGAGGRSGRIPGSRRGRGSCGRGPRIRSRRWPG
jgi:hypothetical protein